MSQPKHQTKGEPAPIFDDTIPDEPRVFADEPTLTRRARAGSINEAEMTVEAVIATPTPVVRRDSRGSYGEILDPAGLVLPVGDLPLYDSHRGGTTKATIGRAYNIRVEGDEVLATLRFSAADDVEPIWQRVVDGTVRNVSAGYAVQGWAEGSTNGARTKTATSWTLREVSITPEPADPNSRLRSEPQPKEIPHMPDTDIELTRRADIRGLARAAGLSAEWADGLIDTGTSLDEAKALAWDERASRTAPIIRTAAPSNGDPALVTRARSDAMAFRAGVMSELPEAARQYQHESAVDMARGCLKAAGTSTRGMSADEVLHRAVHTTSDFPIILQNTANLSVMQGYEHAASAVMKLSKKRTVSDFKPATSVRLGEGGALQEVPESGELKAVSRGESGESISIKTYGARWDASRQLLINDQLGLLGDMAAELGRAAAAKVADLLVENLTSNPVMSDGLPVFDVTRGNLEPTGLAVGDAGFTFRPVRTHFRKLKGLDGVTPIDATPRYLLVSPDAEEGAEKMMAALYPATSDDVNLYQGRFEILVEPRLGGQTWWMFADPAKVPALQHAYLSGHEGPTVQRQEAWDTLGVSFRVFMDFGAGWLDWRGAYRSDV